MEDAGTTDIAKFCNTATNLSKCEEKFSRTRSPLLLSTVPHLLNCLPHQLSKHSIMRKTFPHQLSKFSIRRKTFPLQHSTFRIMNKSLRKTRKSTSADEIRDRVAVNGDIKTDENGIVWGTKKGTGPTLNGSKTRPAISCPCRRLMQKAAMHTALIINYPLSSDRCGDRRDSRCHTTDQLNRYLAFSPLRRR